MQGTVRPMVCAVAVALMLASAASLHAVRRATTIDAVALSAPATAIVIDGGRIAEVLPGSPRVDDAQSIDAGGRVVLPGLIDAHVHVTATTHDLTTLGLQPPSLITAETSVVMRDMLLAMGVAVREGALLQVRAGGALHDRADCHVVAVGDAALRLLAAHGCDVVSITPEHGRLVRCMPAVHAPLPAAGRTTGAGVGGGAPVLPTR